MSLANSFIWLALLAGAAIAFWNARAAGLGWEDSKISGGFGRIMMWCGVFQSALGFSEIFLCLITMLLKARHTLPPEAESLVNGVRSAAYVIPALGAGFFLAIQRWLTFAEDQDTFSGARALGATAREFREINAVASAFSGPPRIDEGRSSSNSSSKNNGALLLLAIIIVSIAFLGGALVTYIIVVSYSYKARAERTSAPRLRENAVAEVRHRARQIF